MPAPPVAPVPAVPDRRAVLAAIRGRIDPAPVPFPYRLALAGVALAMVLLPLVYLALVGTAAYATWWHAVHHLTWLAGRGSARGRMFVYATPIVGGLTTVFFMIKPLLARHAPKQQPLVLDRRKEPFLFDFVDRLCRTIGAPPPVRIEVDCEVNASAHRVGFAGTGGLVLTIGLPLVAGLTLRQMTGVLAHEFGHFAQGAGMRVSAGYGVSTSGSPGSSTSATRGMPGWRAPVAKAGPAASSSWSRACSSGCPAACCNC